MPSNTPEEAAQAFYRAFNAGDIDAVLAMYEPQAIMVDKTGQVIKGHAAIREDHAAFLAMRPTLTAEKHQVVTAGDVALVVAKWTLKGTGTDGQPVHMASTATDVYRRQADGSWRCAIDNSWGVDILG